MQYKIRRCRPSPSTNTLRSIPLLVHLHLLPFLWIQPTVLDRRLHPPNVLLHVLPVQLRRFRVRGAIWVRIVQQALDRRQDRGDVVRGGPPILEDVEAEFAVGVYVWVEHAREEFHRGGFVGVGFVEGEHELERAIFKGRVGCSVGLERVAGRERRFRSTGARRR